VLYANALISQDTTNIVTVTGSQESGLECEADADFSVVRVEERPRAGRVHFRIVATELRYIGPDLPGPVTVKVVARFHPTHR